LPLLIKISTVEASPAVFNVQKKKKKLDSHAFCTCSNHVFYVYTFEMDIYM
jgi:hypothetical protein